MPNFTFKIKIEYYDMILDSKNKGLPEAINYYGMMLLNGSFVPIDEKEAAVSCFKISAEKRKL